MDYRREYKRFINSYYFAEGLRITAGVTLPAIIFNFFGDLNVGMILSLGAICVSAADIPGPIQLRRNGMLACICIVTVVAFITGYLATDYIMMGVLIGVFGFFFSMFGVYGARVNSIGVAALLIMVLSIFRLRTDFSITLNALYVAAGGAWYMVMSLAVYSFRPFRLIQQALGDSITAVAAYLRARSNFYRTGVNYDAVFREVIDRQADVQKKQLLVRELMYRSRHVTKESSTRSRTLLLMFTDTVDLFEKATTSIYSYETLHSQFGQSGILPRFGEMIAVLAETLDEVGIAIQSARRSEPPATMRLRLRQLQTEFERFAPAHRNQDNLEAMLSLRKILQSIEDVAARIETLHLYSSYDPAQLEKSDRPRNYDQFIDRTSLDPSLFFASLTLKSAVFRHAIRVSLAMLTGYIISRYVSIGHSYWILLTIIVILKPTYSLTRSRNLDRLIGTVAGALVGFGLLYFVQDRSILFVIMLVLMAGSYSFMRTKYLVSVIFMTPYVLILFYLLGTADFQLILKDRIIDTFIGSGIAFLASFLLIPSWEKEQILHYASEAITTSTSYFETAAQQFTLEPYSSLTHRVNRKHAFVALGNLSEAFTRMLAEPKAKQPKGPLIHQLVVLVHSLNSHIASLGHFASDTAVAYRSAEFAPLIAGPLAELRLAAATVSKTAHETPAEIEESQLPDHVEQLMDQRWSELRAGKVESETRAKLSALKPVVDQFLFIGNIAHDLRKICASLMKGQ